LKLPIKSRGESGKCFVYFFKSRSKNPLKSLPISIEVFFALPVEIEFLPSSASFKTEVD